MATNQRIILTIVYSCSNKHPSRTSFSSSLDLQTSCSEKNTNREINIIRTIKEEMKSKGKILKEEEGGAKDLQPRLGTNR